MDEINAFKRLLKEIGLYKAWIRGRCYIIAHEWPSETIFDVVDNKETLHRIIDGSFWWDQTGKPFLWENIYNHALSVSDFSISQILTMDDFIEDLRKIVKKYT